MRSRFTYVDRTKFVFLLERFPRKPKALILLFWLGQYLVSDTAVKPDAGPPWGSGSNQRWFDSLSVRSRWFLVDDSVPSQNSVFVLSLIPNIRSWASQEALFLCFSPGTIAQILLICVLMSPHGHTEKVDSAVKLCLSCCHQFSKSY